MANKSDGSLSEKQIGFINQFVNAVYGILLGYGFSDAMREIKDGKPEGVGPIFSSFSIAFIIIIVCIYWWDWFKNIGKRVESNAREFVIDMTILVALESLFFVYEKAIVFASVMFILSVLNLSWVVNYHSTLKKNANFASWSKYIHKNPEVKTYIKKRLIGAVMFGCCLVFTLLLKTVPGLNKDILLGLKKEIWGGNWIELLMVVIVFSLNRILFYRKRPGIESDITPPNRERMG